MTISDKKLRKPMATQLDVLRRMMVLSGPARLVRESGGFWTVPGAERTERGTPIWWVSVQTVEAMEKAGLLVCEGLAAEWCDNRVLTGLGIDAYEKYALLPVR